MNGFCFGLFINFKRKLQVKHFYQLNTVNIYEKNVKNGKIILPFSQDDYLCLIKLTMLYLVQPFLFRQTYESEQQHLLIIPLKLHKIVVYNLELQRLTLE